MYSYSMPNIPFMYDNVDDRKNGIVTYNNMVIGETLNATDGTMNYIHTNLRSSDESEVTGGLKIKERKFREYECLKFILL